jgi:hypothetical protein
MNNPLGKWCYSTSNEDYSGHCETEADAHGEAQCEIDEDGELGESHDYWIASIRHPLDCIGQNIGGDVFEMLDERIADEVGGDDAALDMTTEEVKELGLIIMTYVREHASVQRYGIKDPVKHQYVVGSNAA